MRARARLKQRPLLRHQRIRQSADAHERLHAMTDTEIKAIAEAALDAAKPKWRGIERKIKAALLRDVRAAIKGAMPAEEKADEV